MSGIRDLINKYSKIANDLPEQRQKLALVYASDAFSMVADRIQNDGIDARGNKMKPYSEKKINLSKLDPTLFNAPSKIIQFKKDAKEGKNNGSYSALRKAYGLTISKRTLTFDGTMFASIEQKVVYHDEFKTIVEIRASNDKDQIKVDQNSKIVGINILAFGKTEQDLLSDLNKERIQKLLR